MEGKPDWYMCGNAGICSLFVITKISLLSFRSVQLFVIPKRAAQRNLLSLDTSALVAPASRLRPPCKHHESRQVESKQVPLRCALRNDKRECFVMTKRALRNDKSERFVMTK